MMKKLFFASIIAVAVSHTLAGEVYVVDNAAGKTPVLVRKDPSELKPIAQSGGKPNQGFSYGNMLTLHGLPNRVWRGRIEAGGRVNVHEGPNVYVWYAVSGSGKVNFFDKAGEKVVLTVPYKADDIVVFLPNTLHDIVSTEGQVTEFVGFDYLQPK